MMLSFFLIFHIMNINKELKLPCTNMEQSELSMKYSLLALKCIELSPPELKELSAGISQSSLKISYQFQAIFVENLSRSEWKNKELRLLEFLNRIICLSLITLWLKIINFPESDSHDCISHRRVENKWLNQVGHLLI